MIHRPAPYPIHHRTLTYMYTTPTRAPRRLRSRPRQYSNRTNDDGRHGRRERRFENPGAAASTSLSPSPVTSLRPQRPPQPWIPMRPSNRPRQRFHRQRSQHQKAVHYAANWVLFPAPSISMRPERYLVCGGSGGGQWQWQWSWSWSRSWS